MSVKFSDLYKNGAEPVISFEVFPPGTPEGRKNLLRTLDELAELSPGFISVTYGAMGTTRENSFETASYIKNKLGVEPASHLTCVGASREETDAALTELRARGICNIVALRGDPPAGRTKFVPAAGGYSHANELVSHIRDFEKREPSGTRFGIAVAGYPEKHVEAPSMSADIENLGKKVRAGADITITQMFFDNSFYFDYARKVRDFGITTPVIPGLMPILSTRQIVKIASLCGSSIPDSVMRRLANCGNEGADAGRTGAEICAEQAEDLLRGGAPGIHFYVLNRASHVKSILKRLGV